MSLKTRTVYILSSALTPKVYIGSTCKKLSHRLQDHKDLKCSSREIIIFEDVKISPLCVVENCTRKEISLKECDFIFAFKDICVNISGIKDSKSKDYKAPYVLDGRQKDWKNTKIVCCDCGGKYTNCHKARHFKSTKHISKI